MTNLSVKIPNQVYVAFHRPSKDQALPYGMMTTYETNAAGKKRVAKMDYFASKQSKPLKCVILDNGPMYGFRISRSQRRDGGWSSTSQSIFIEDPRGFEVTISVSNFIMLTDGNLIHDGEIIQQCVWAKDGDVDKLLPVNSDPYTEAEQNTERMSKSVSIRKVEPGNRIIMQSGVEGIYLGSLYPVTSGSSYDHRNSKLGSLTEAFVPKRRKHVIRVEGKGTESTQYLGFQSMKISEILSTDVLTQKEVAEILNGDDFDKVRCTGLTARYSYRCNGLMDSIPTLKMELVELSNEEKHGFINSLNYRSETLIAKNNATGDYYLVVNNENGHGGYGYHYRSNSTPSRGIGVKVVKFDPANFTNLQYFESKFVSNDTVDSTDVNYTWYGVTAILTSTVTDLQARVESM